MSDQLLNCWEIKGCGRDPGGDNISRYAICPATEEGIHDRINRGVCGGRICWAIAGTYCDGSVQGLFSEKIESCISCEVFQRVVAEEKEDFKMYPGDGPFSAEDVIKACNFEKE